MFVKMAGLPYVKRVLQAKVSTPFLKIVECSSFQYGTGAGGFPADRRRGRDFIYTKISVRPKSGFYRHKETPALAHVCPKPEQNKIVTHQQTDKH